MTEAELLLLLRRLAMIAREAGGGRWTAAPSGPPAAGSEFVGHRDYSPGDDYRRIDWHVCARHDELVVRRFGGRAEQELYLLVDASRSMALGRPAKFEAAVEIAAALAYVALADLTRIAVTIFSDRIEADFSPLRDERRVLTLLRFLARLSPSGGTTSLAAATAQFVRRRQPRGPVVVISDLYDPAGFAEGIERLRRGGYPPRLVQVYDPADAIPPEVGDAALVDVETGSHWQLTLTEHHQAEYRRRYRDYFHGVRVFAAVRGIPCVQIPCNLPQQELLDRAVRGVSVVSDALESR